MRDIMNLLSFVSALNPAAARNASVNGNSIDVTALNAGNDGLCFEVTAGVITDGTHVFSLQDSLDGGTTWNAVAAPYLQTPAGQTNQFVAATPAGTTMKFGYLGNPNLQTLTGGSVNPTLGAKVLVRLISTVTGATTGGLYSAVAVLDMVFNLPAA